VRLLHARNGHELRGLLGRKPDVNLDDVKSAISGHLCRCGTYPNIFKATLAGAVGKGKAGER
jgi:xanthine dehydrogenase YagT iron-sulfur-binding subunit